MIPKETVDRILDSVQIADVVGDFVPLRRRGANFVACCPFHNEKTPSFYVSPAKGIYKCFGCGKSGTAVGFVMEHENMTYSEALKYLARKYNIEVVEKEETAEEIARRQRSESLYLVSGFAADFFRKSLKTQEGHSVGYAYFKARKLEDATIEKFGLGWAPSGRHALADAAKSAGYKDEFLIDTGLCVRREDTGVLQDRFFDRVVFPIHSVSGRVIAFGARTLRTDKTLAKYVNSPETEIYVKSRSLYGIYFAKNEISRQDKCYLVEGYLDVISMHQLGITNVVASSGTSLTVEQIRLIRKFTRNVTIIYDGDSAGIHAALRGIGLVLKEDMNVKVVLLPDGDDPDSYSHKHTLEEVRSFIDGHEQDFISFKTDILTGQAGDDPLKKAELINDVADTIALIPDAVKRSVYVETSSARFNIESQILFDRINHTRGEMLLADKKQREAQWRREHGQEAQDAGAAGGEFTGSYPAEIPSGARTGEKASKPAVHLDDTYLAPCEKELLGFILEHGENLLEFDRDSEFYSQDGQKMTVAEFIDSTLASDDVAFVNTAYRKVYDEYFEMYDEGLSQEQIQRRLLNSTDNETALVASDILVEKYMITVENYRNSLTSVGTQLVIFVPKTLMAYQVKRIDKRLQSLFSDLAAAGDDASAQIRIMNDINVWNRAKSQINARLGR